MGIRKGGLMDFISPELAIDELAPVQSSISLIRRFLNRELSFQQIDISRFSSSQWKENLETLFAPYQKILLIHDYEERIG